MKQEEMQYTADQKAKISLDAIGCRQRSTWEREIGIRGDKTGDVVDRPSWRSLFLGDPGHKGKKEEQKRKKGPVGTGC